MSGWRTRLLSVCLLLATTVGIHAQPPSPGGDRARLIGNYRLVSFQSLDEKGAARPGQYNAGRIMYDAAGQMAAQLMLTTRAKATPTSDAERATAYRSYFAYYGGYTVDEAKGMVTHHLQGSTNPSSTGTDFVRYYTFSGDGKHLTLSVKNAEGRVTGVLLWERF